MSLRALWNFFVVEGYLWDWLTAAGAIVINLILPSHVVHPLDRSYELTDPTLSYPSRDSSVPSYAMYILVFVLPAVVFTVGAILKRSAGLVDWHHALLSLAEGFALTTGFKRWTALVGVLRPHWLTAVASGDKGEIDDSRLSYPSGHAAYMFFSMTIVSLYVLGKLEMLVRPSQLLFLKSILAVAPLGLALFVAVSRIADYKHSPADVNAGCFIGAVCGGFAYFLNYPSLFSRHCGVAKRRGDAAAAAAAAAAGGAKPLTEEEAEAMYGTGGTVGGSSGGGGARGRGRAASPMSVGYP